MKVHKSLEVGRFAFLRKKMKGEAALCTINFQNTEVMLERSTFKVLCELEGPVQRLCRILSDKNLLYFQNQHAKL